VDGRRPARQQCVLGVTHPPTPSRPLARRCTATQLMRGTMYDAVEIGEPTRRGISHPAL
jgi:hypothetical protein